VAGATPRRSLRNALTAAVGTTIPSISTSAPTSTLAPCTSSQLETMLPASNCVPPRLTRSSRGAPKGTGGVTVNVAVVPRFAFRSSCTVCAAFPAAPGTENIDAPRNAPGTAVSDPVPASHSAVANSVSPSTCTRVRRAPLVGCSALMSGLPQAALASAPTRHVATRQRARGQCLNIVPCWI